jgi:hypothetical protein
MRLIRRVLLIALAVVILDALGLVEIRRDRLVEIVQGLRVLVAERVLPLFYLVRDAWTSASTR